MEQLSPFPPPQSNDEGAKEQKRAILTSLKWQEKKSIFLDFLIVTLVTP